MRISRRGWLCSAILALAFVAAVITHSVWYRWLGEYLVVNQEPFHADRIVVLGGDLRGGRVLKGAELARAGYAPLVMVSGSGDIYGFHESDLAVAWAVKNGFDEGLFVKLKYPAVSTRDEAHEVVRELRRNGVKSFLLVTSTFHTRRSASIFREEAPDLRFHTIASPDRYFTPNEWWKNREGQKTFGLEWWKTVANWLRI